MGMSNGANASIAVSSDNPIVCWQRPVLVFHTEDFCGRDVIMQMGNEAQSEK